MPVNFRAVQGGTFGAPGQGQPYGTPGPVPAQAPSYPKPPPDFSDPTGHGGQWSDLTPDQQQKVWEAYKNSSSYKTQSAVDEFQGESKQLGTDFQNASGKPGDVSRYYEEQKQPIESNFFNSANQVSSYLARQGLGSSGMNLGAHAQLENNRSALEAQAQRTAIDSAIQKEREGLLGKFQMNMGGLQPELQKYGIDTSRIIAQMQMQMQMEMLQKEMDAQRSAGVGSLIGGGAGLFLGGSPMAGYMGSQLGGQVGGAFS
jgi:hypothetical protein